MQTYSEEKMIFFELCNTHLHISTLFAILKVSPDENQLDFGLEKRQTFYIIQSQTNR